MTAKQLAKDLIAYIKKSVSPYHVVETSMEILKKQGFEELDFFTEWKLEAGKKYLVKPYGTQLFAFSMPSDIKGRFALRIAAAHTDAPGLHIKPVAELAQKNYLRLNTDIYGGPILNTWLDRPLSIAGRVALASEDLYKPELVLVDFEKPSDFAALESMEDVFDPETGELMLGDIVISADKVLEQADDYGHSVKREFAFLVAHSMYHLLGYDHMTDSEEEEMI